MRDHGIGLKPGEERLVFNRFWRADPSRARQTGGTGLGLSISVEDARLHGGWLEAWGAPGEGAQFRLTLPVRAGDRLVAAPLPLIPRDRAAEPALPKGPGFSAPSTGPGAGGSTDPEGPGFSAPSGGPGAGGSSDPKGRGFSAPSEGPGAGGSTDPEPAEVTG